MKRDGEAGYTLVMLMAALTIMLITMGLGVPFWRYLVQDDQEQELLFRGSQIAEAIERYQARHASAPPPSLEVLVEQRFLRRLYTDPMSESGEWRLVRPGEAIAPGQPPGPGGALTGQPTPTPTPPPASARAKVGALGPGSVVGGGVLGVASTSKEKSFRLFNGRSRYDEWLFIAGQPRVVGSQASGPLQGLVPGPGQGPATPGPKPTPLGGSAPGRR